MFASLDRTILPETQDVISAIIAMIGIMYFINFCIIVFLSMALLVPIGPLITQKRGTANATF